MFILIATRHHGRAGFSSWKWSSKKTIPPPHQNVRSVYTNSCLYLLEYEKNNLQANLTPQYFTPMSIPLALCAYLCWTRTRTGDQQWPSSRSATVLSNPMHDVRIKDVSPLLKWSIQIRVGGLHKGNVQMGKVVSRLSFWCAGYFLCPI